MDMIYCLMGLSKYSFVECSIIAKDGIARRALVGFQSGKMSDY